MTDRTAPKVATWMVLAIALAAPLLVSVASASPLPVASATEHVFGASSGGYQSEGITGHVTWNGVDIRQAANVSSAFQVGYSSSAIDIRFFWNVTNPGTSYNVTSVQLQMFYFGLAVATRSVSPITQQTGDMQWDAVQTVQWLIEGTFALTASLIAPGGGTLWSEGFFVHVAAPYNLLAAVPILLILVLIYEIYNVATSGSQEKGSKSKGKAPPASSPSASGTGTASTPAQGAGEPPAGGGTT